MQGSIGRVIKITNVRAGCCHETCKSYTKLQPPFQALSSCWRDVHMYLLIICLNKGLTLLVKRQLWSGKQATAAITMAENTYEKCQTFTYRQAVAKLHMSMPRDSLTINNTIFAKLQILLSNIEGWVNLITWAFNMQMESGLATGHISRSMCSSIMALHSAADNIGSYEWSYRAHTSDEYMPGGW